MAVVFSPDNRLILTAGPELVRVWDAHTLGRLGDAIRPGGHINVASFSPDGKSILIAGGSEPRVSEVRTSRGLSKSRTAGQGEARLWDVRTRKLLAGPMRHGSTITCAGFNPDGSRLVTVADGDKEAIIWDTATGRRVLSLAHPGPVRFAVFSPNGKRILTIGTDKPNGTARVWNASSGKSLFNPVIGAIFYPERRPLTPAAFTPDSKYFCTLDGYGAGIYNAATGQIFRDIPAWERDEMGPLGCVAFDADGKRLVTGAGLVRVWDVKTKEQLGKDMVGEWACADETVAFTPGGKRIVISAQFGNSGLWDIESGKQTLQVMGDGPNESNTLPVIAISSDGKRLVVGYPGDANAQVWEVYPETK